MSVNCNPQHFNSLNRRGFLSLGLLAGTSLTLPQLLRSNAAYGDLKDYKNFEGTAKSIIHIFLPGGIAHQESFDPKPYAPIEYRGEMGQVATKISGEVFGDTLAKTAQVADKLTVIRSMTHGEAAHERGTHNMFTGYRPSPALIYPCIGSVVSHEYGPRNNLPPYVCIPNMPTEFAGSGYLSSAFAPFSLGSDPATKGFKVRDLDLPKGVDDSRFATRRSALEAVNAHFQKKEKSDDLTAMDTFYDRAYSLISSPALIAELAGVLARDKFRTILSRSGTDPQDLLGRVRLLLEIVEPPRLSMPVSRDPDDDEVLAVAAASRPDLIVSGDEDLLVLGGYAGVPIVSPARAVEIIRAGG